MSRRHDGGASSTSQSPVAVLGLLILAFIALPVLELIVLLRIGSWLGLLPTLLLILATGVIGAAVARSQGMQVIAHMRRDLAEGKPPVARVIDGALILAAGLLLVTPGVISDVMGILLLLPPTRALVRRLMATRMKHMIENGRAQFTIMHGGRPPDSERSEPTPGRDVTDL